MQDEKLRSPSPARAVPTLVIITFLTVSAWSLLLLLEAEPVPSYFTVRYFPLETLAPNNQGALQKVLVFINYFWGHKRSEQNKWWLFYGLCLVDPGPLQFAARGSHLITPWLCRCEAALGTKMLNWLLVGTSCSRQHMSWSWSNASAGFSQ